MGFQAIQALPIGQVSTNGALAPLLGSTVWSGLTQYMLVKSDTAAITSAANVFLKWKSGSAGTYVVDAVTGAAALAGTVAGIPQLPSGVTTLAASSYVWVARRGPATGTTAGAVTAGIGLATHSTAGAVDDTTVTYDTVVARAMDAIGSATTGTIYVLLG